MNLTGRLILNLRRNHNEGLLLKFLTEVIFPEAINKQLNMKKSVDQVLEFQNAFGHPVGESPQIPSAGENKFRKEFIKEELDELDEALEDGDVVALADALGDIQYVLDGWFVTSGMHKHKDAIMTEIHRSNMTKACNNLDEVTATLVVLAEKFPEEEMVYEEREYLGKVIYVIYRKRDHKIMKSKYYSKPDLASIVG